MMRPFLLMLFTLLVTADRSAAQIESNGLLIAEIDFVEGSDVIARVGPSDAALDVLARTLGLFGARRDIKISLIVSDEILRGTIAADRKRSIMLEARKVDARAQIAALDLQFSSNLPTPVARLMVSADTRNSEFCPWTIEMSLKGWNGSLLLPAMRQNRLPAPKDLSLGFIPHKSVPFSKSLMECSGAIQVQGTGMNAPTAPCRIFLIASTQEIEDITLPEIKLALLNQGKGTGSALLSTQLSGTAICEVQLTDY